MPLFIIFYLFGLSLITCIWVVLSKKWTKLQENTYIFLNLPDLWKIPRFADSGKIKPAYETLRENIFLVRNRNNIFVTLFSCLINYFLHQQIMFVPYRPIISRRIYYEWLCVDLGTALNKHWQLCVLYSYNSNCTLVSLV